MFSKHFLGVRKQTNTDGVLLEMGMIPLYLYAIKSATKNWERIQQGKANTLLNISNKYSREQHLPWAWNIQHIFSTSGMLREYQQKINETEERRYGPISNKLFKKLVEMFHESTLNAIQTSSKMKTLALLKSTPGMEPYLRLVSNSKHRTALTRLRLSAHRLEIETGRYTIPKTEAENRYCAHCKFEGHTAVEDEIHFLINCPMLDKLREDMLPPQILKNENMSDVCKFVEIMTNYDIKMTAKFVFLAFKEREIKLDVLSTLKNLVSSAELILKKEKNTPDPGNLSTYQVKWCSSDGMKLMLSKV